MQGTQSSRVRFTTARAGLCGCHISGLVYEVSPEFARQVVEVERCAEYVSQGHAVPDAGVRQARKK